MLLPSILEDLQEIKLQFRDEVSRNGDFSAKSLADHRFIQSSLVLVSGKLGKYNFTKLKPVAVAVELLDVAIREHYNKVKNNAKVNKDDLSCLCLIRGDYLYARALNLVSTLGDCRIVKLLSQVIADISESNLEKVPIAAMPIQEITIKLKKLASLYITSVALGTMLSEVKPVYSRMLADFGLYLGLFYETGETARLYFFQAAKKSISKLPQRYYQQMLERLLDFI